MRARYLPLTLTLGAPGAYLTPGPYIRLLRPSDWLKNLIVFAALVFSGKASDPHAVGQAAIAFGAFCLIASGFYAINDALDVDSDQLHPIKRLRPVPSGQVTRHAAFLLGGVLIAAGLAVSFSVNALLGLIACLYLLLQTLYNLRLKRVLTVDVVILSVGFVLRAAAGAAAINVQISIWLAMCVFFLCMFLGYVKRLADVTSARMNGETGWTSPAGYEDSPQLHWLLSISATLAVMTYLMYTLSPHANRLFGARAIGLALLAPLAVIAIHRFYLRANEGRSDRPLDALKENFALQSSVALFIVGTLLVLYVPTIGRLLDTLFLH